MKDQQPILQVKQLNELVRNMLEGSLASILVEGEISNFTAPASGHWYFSLKDDNAQVRCAMFRFQQQAMNFTPENGKQVVVKAKASLYPGRGDFQLIVNDMQENGLGDLQRQFEALKAKCEKAGLFAAEYKKILPTFCHRIAVITSATGAAVHDVLTTLKRRYPLADIWHYATLVQGKTAAPSIINAILQANKDQQADVILLVRGGGSLEDLWCFNDEDLIHAIFNSRIPIVSGVGHEVDFTLTDFVADHRCATPTAAAEFVTPNQQNLKQKIEQHQHYLQQIISAIVLQKQQQLRLLERHLQALHPRQQLQQAAQQLDYLTFQLKNLLQIKYQQAQNSLAQLAATLNAVSPLKTLCRGYSITLCAGKAVTSVKTVKPGQTLTTRLIDGEVKSIVK